MSRPVARGNFHRWCRRCGWKGTYPTEGRADYAKRKHSCARQLDLAARRANGEAIAERRATLDRTPKPCLHKLANHQHGTYACYTLDACRCLPCAAAVRVYEQNRVRQQAYGRWDNLVDAEPARQHIRSLMAAGMGLKRIAAVGGASQGQLWKLLYGKKRADGSRTPSKRVRKEVSERLLAIELDLADGAKIDTPIGVPRRIQALVALGWSQSLLAQRLGILRSNFHLAEHRRTITAARVRQVEALYDELSMTLPPEGEWRERIAASRARRYARERGWAPPLAWDEDTIDDPSAAPHMPSDAQPAGLDEQAIWRRMHGDKSVRLTHAEKQELRRRWYAAGRTGADLERVCGMAPMTRHHRAPGGVMTTSEPVDYTLTEKGIAATEPQPRAVQPSAGSRLADLHAAYAGAKAAVDATAEQLKAITDAIKVELTALDANERRFDLVPAQGVDARPLELRYVESWRIDSRQLKAKDPVTYATYAKKSGSWRLAESKAAKGGESE